MVAPDDFPPRKSMPALSVICHRCGREFASEVPVGERGIVEPPLEGVVYACPHCGTRDPYFAAEHRQAISGGYAADPNPGPAWMRRIPSRLNASRQSAP